MFCTIKVANIYLWLLISYLIHFSFKSSPTIFWVSHLWGLPNVSLFFFKKIRHCGTLWKSSIVTLRILFAVSINYYRLFIPYTQTLPSSQKRCEHGLSSTLHLKCSVCLKNYYSSFPYIIFSNCDTLLIKSRFVTSFSLDL